MAETKEPPKSPDVREPVVMPAAIVKFDEKYNPTAQQKRRKN